MRQPLEVISGRRAPRDAKPPKIEAAPKSSFPNKPCAAGGRQSVVVIANEDDRERARWRGAIEAAGHGVIEAPTALVLLELAKTRQPDLVVFSIGQDSTLSGYDVLRSIRGDAKTAPLPCLLTSNDPRDWRPAMTHGADDFLAAPFEDKELLDAVEARLERLRTVNEMAARTSFQHFPSELLELVVRKTPVAAVLERIAKQLEEGVGAIAVVPRLARAESLETIQAMSFSPRTWPELDRLIGKLLEDSAPCANPARKEMAISLSSSLLMFFASQKVNQKPGRLWHVPIRSEEGNLLGAFEIFLGLDHESDLWLTGANRAALDPMFRLAGVLMERQHLFDELTRQTHFDSVTGLPNRKEFERHLREAYRRAEESGTPFALVCLDIDRFQRVNDNYGYQIADFLLAEFAARLRQQSRGQDLVARISGDEFAVFIPDAPDRAVLERLALRLVESLSQPYMIHPHQIVVSVTAGIAVYSEDTAGDPSEMLVRAEMALAAARRSAHSQVALFHRKSAAPSIDGIDMESYLERALATNGFVLHYQPIYRNRGGCVGYEALVRLRRGLTGETPAPKDELVPPGIFLPFAEETGLIVQIGTWVFNETCRQMREWLDSGFACPRVAVNLSARQLGQLSLLDTFSASVSKYRIDPALIELELTETAVIEDSQSGQRRLEELKQFGFRIAIDDFGIGYSSLSYLNQFPADKIKIDQSFVRRLGTRVEDHDPLSSSSTALRRSDPSLPVIGAILSLAANLGAEVVAEGVETPEQYRILSDAGCHEFQGYLFARPMAAASVRTFMDKHHSWTTDRFATHYAERLIPA
ncbi:MAG TPA: EAL domain-containing protein [Bryobacteraceae bacterium]|jgi:diguanylate cyclase (GGDEF)-like protein